MPARIVIAGGTGFLGQALADLLASEGHDVVVLTRRPATLTKARSVEWNPDGSAAAWSAEIDGARAVVNLAGESIAGKRWTAAQKKRILDSRVLATRGIVTAIERAKNPPPVF